jgi:hypothetical protein
LDGGRGRDTLQGGSSPDVLIGGSGDDVMLGGAGDDVVSFLLSSDGVTVNLGTTLTQVVSADQGSDRFGGAAARFEVCRPADRKRGPELHRRHGR